MSLLLLDTNVLSELRRVGLGRADAHFAAWATNADEDSFRISVIMLQEITFGALLMERRDPAQGAALRRWIDGQVMVGFRGRIYDVDAAVAMRCAALHVPRKRPALDALIAATALVHGHTVVTRNVADFGPMGVPVLNPWKS